jgi:NTE family protein
MNASRGFLHHLRDLGVQRAEAFLAAHFDAIGERSSTDIVHKFL